MNCKTIFFILILFVSFQNAQALNGSLLLIGGGSEKDYPNSWSTAAYTWAVDQSTHKKVAIISFTDASDWLPDYFINTCGAISAQNFTINTPEIANAQETFDQLIQYDVIFLKGGDQFNYYSTYKNTKTQEAIEAIFNNGGVICGTSAGLAILSGVVFTAQNGSVYPEESIEDPMLDDIVLSDSMFQFFPGYIFDTHFTIRGRFARLLAFMANWKFASGKTIKGIGVDEMTAMAISQDGIGTTYGIGTVNIYETTSDETFSISNSKLIADEIKVHQLLQGCSINFNTGEITGFESETNPAVVEETGNYTVFASGSDNINYNTEVLSDFVESGNGTQDEVLIITKSSSSLGGKIEDELVDLGVSVINSIEINASVASDSEIAAKIQSADKYIIADNNYDDFFGFINGGSSGSMLNTKVRANSALLCFIGDNSRFAGATVVRNYLVADAAYYDELEFDQGLELLKTTVIIPNTYFGSSFYENTATAVPYSLIEKDLTYGVWLSSNNYFKYAPNNGKTYINASGSVPVMILKNDGTPSGFSVQSSTGNSSYIPQYSGFEEMTLSLIDETTPYKVGDSVIESSLKSRISKNIDIHRIGDNLVITGSLKKYSVNIVSMSGQLVKCQNFNQQASITIKDISKGVYVVSISDTKGSFIENKKIVF